MSKLFDLLGLGGGKKFYMRDFKNAYTFRPDVNPVRQKFQGYVNFVFNRSIFSNLYSNDGSTNEFRNTISSLVRTADLPSVQFQTETKNQYNRKKIVNTGVEYAPVTITVYDTVGNEWLTTLMKYFAYHYMDPRNKFRDGRDIEALSSGEGGEETIMSKFREDKWDSNLAGYNINANAHFFERIDYVLYHGNKGVQYSIINPVITSFVPGNLDYSDSQFRDFTISFQYERFTVYNVTNFGLSEADLARFENVSGITGPAFEAAQLSPVMDSRELRILGETPSDPSERPRTGQPVPPPKVQNNDQSSEQDQLDDNGNPVSPQNKAIGENPDAADVQNTINSQTGQQQDSGRTTDDYYDYVKNLDSSELAAYRQNIESEAERRSALNNTSLSDERNKVHREATESWKQTGSLPTYDGSGNTGNTGNSSGSGTSTSVAGSSNGALDLRTYGDAATIATGSDGGAGEPSFFQELLADTADSALTALINGGSVKDAAIGTAVGLIGTQVGTQVRNAISSNNPNANTPLKMPTRGS